MQEPTMSISEFNKLEDSYKINETAVVVADSGRGSEHSVYNLSSSYIASIGNENPERAINKCLVVTPGSQMMFYTIKLFWPDYEDLKRPDDIDCSKRWCYLCSDIETPTSEELIKTFGSVLLTLLYHIISEVHLHRVQKWRVGFLGNPCGKLWQEDDELFVLLRYVNELRENVICHRFIEPGSFAEYEVTCVKNHPDAKLDRRNVPFARCRLILNNLKKVPVIVRFEGSLHSHNPQGFYMIKVNLFVLYIKLSSIVLVINNYGTNSFGCVEEMRRILN